MVRLVCGFAFACVFHIICVVPATIWSNHFRVPKPPQFPAFCLCILCFSPVFPGVFKFSRVFSMNVFSMFFYIFLLFLNIFHHFSHSFPSFLAMALVRNQPPPAWLPSAQARSQPPPAAPPVPSADLRGESLGDSELESETGEL